jgi:DNA-binding IclR family transcriptional regulator
VYLIRLVKEDYAQPHATAYVEEHVARDHFRQDVRYYRQKGWSVDEEEVSCGVNVIRRAEMVRKGDEGYERAMLLLEQFPIIKK